MNGIPSVHDHTFGRRAKESAEARDAKPRALPLFPLAYNPTRPPNGNNNDLRTKNSTDNQSCSGLFCSLEIVAALTQRKTYTNPGKSMFLAECEPSSLPT